MASLIFKVLQRYSLTMFITFIGTNVQLADQQSTPRAKRACTLLQCKARLMTLCELSCWALALA